MWARLFKLEEGPEWEESLREADPHDSRFDENLAALKMALEVDPYRYSFPLVEEHDEVRVATTKDVAAGYRLVIGIRLKPPVVTLGWIAVEPLE